MSMQLDTDRQTEGLMEDRTEGGERGEVFLALLLLIGRDSSLQGP